MSKYYYISGIFVIFLSIICYQHFRDANFDEIRDQVKKTLATLLHHSEKTFRERDDLKLDLATIDMTAAQTDSKTVATKLYHALKVVGFAYLVNVPGFRPDELLQATKWLFSQPSETKMRIAKKAFRNENLNRFRGYYPVIPGGHSFKEAFEVGAFFDKDYLDKEKPTDNTKDGSEKMSPGPLLMRNVVSEANVWPSTDNSTEDKIFKELMQNTFHFYATVAQNVMHLMEEGLGLDPGYFDKLFGQNQLSTLRLLHYPTRVNSSDIPDEAKDGDVLITTGEHADSSFITVLATFENTGLQVKLTDDGPWLDVPPRKDGLVINIGQLLSDIINNKFKATKHRVLDLGTDRYSVPFFYEPNFDGDISKAINGETIGFYKKYGPWMTNRTGQFVEYATTDFGIAD